MGSSPSIPSYKAPSGAPSYMPSQGIDIQQLQNAYQNQKASPGASNISSIWQNSGLGGLPSNLGIQSPEGQAVSASVIGNAMSDADFAQRYPGMIQAQQTYQGYLNNLLSNQTPASIAAGNSLMSYGNSLLPQGKQIIGQGQSAINQGSGIVGQGQGIVGQGQSFLPLSQQIIGQGQSLLPYASQEYNQAQGMLPYMQGAYGAGRGLIHQAQNFYQPAQSLAAGAQAAGQPDIALGQKMISGNQAIDPVVQQELMRSGLSSAAGALGGAAALGGQAGQAAVGRNLGVGAANYIAQRQQQGQALQTTGAGLTGALSGAAGTLAGAGTGITGAGTGLLNAGTDIANASTGMTNAASGIVGASSGLIGSGVGVGGLGANIMNAGTGVMNAGTGLMGTGSGIIGAGTGVVNAGTGAVTGGQNVVNNAVTNANQSFGLASGMFQPRTFGLSPTDTANISLSNTAGLNNMMQYLYSTKVQGAQYNTQIAGQNANAAAQSQGNLISGGVGAASAAATVATVFAMSCWVAHLVFGPLDPRFKGFRFWLMNVAPKWFRKFYLIHGRAFAGYAESKPVLRSVLKLVMTPIALPYVAAF